MLQARLRRRRRVAAGLLWLASLACSPKAGESVPGGQPCADGDRCDGGWLCFEGVCRKVCNDHRQCGETEACDRGVCLPVADYECDEDTDCEQPSACESIYGADCYAGKCHYSSNPAAEGLPCDDENQCTRDDACDATGACRGEEIVCDAPPPDICLENDAVFRHHENIGGCNPTSGRCEYAYRDTDCAPCGLQCLGLPGAPANLSASAGDAQVTLTWEAMQEAQSYQVYVSEAAGQTANADPVPAAGPTLVHSGLSNGTTYHFAVSAVVDGCQGYMSAEVPATPRISVPEGVSARGGDAQVTLTWDPVPRADEYYVYWTDAPGVTSSSPRLSATTSPFVHAAVENNSEYYYAVSAVDEPSESVLSVEVSARTLMNRAARLQSGNTQLHGRFGWSVALDGDLAVVGADLEEARGAAYVVRRTDLDAWAVGTRLSAFDAQSGDSFGASVALSGDYAIVGASAEDGDDGDPRSDAGAAYVFRRTGDDAWDAGVKLQALDAQPHDAFGTSVALSGDYAIIGARWEDRGESDPIDAAGAAYVFRRTGENTWDAGTQLWAPDAQPTDAFGAAVAISGDYAIVGAVWEDGGDGDPKRDAGAAYVFRRTGENDWDAGTRLQALDAKGDDRFGTSVAVSGDIAIVGARNEDGGDGDPVRNVGAAYLFRRTDWNSWDAGTKLLPPDGRPDDIFGIAVAASGGFVIVGAVGEDGGDGNPAPNAGAAYVFDVP